MIKKIIISILVILIIGMLVYFLQRNHGMRLGEKPAIVDYFTCSDYCPGPMEKYIVKVYKGVDNEKDCKNLGGRFVEMFGWKTQKYCAVK